jgi:hypothetical protein
MYICTNGFKSATQRNNEKEMKVETTNGRSRKKSIKNL